MRRIAALKICTTSAFVLNIAVRNTSTADMDQLMKFALALLCVVIAMNLGTFNVV